ncbi:uncharacterized protein LOC62_05G006727 [Vanrija pseudolonga]|uniref:Uncharacterized protein n=1 Tax=Vanrija pseudolonga TaxID=143232 RepID=A0AAF1BNI6_9TREE|nr:hypothetical protein LOC62_05G006727 [Vanrija pseudolonga]
MACCMRRADLHVVKKLLTSIIVCITDSSGTIQGQGLLVFPGRVALETISLPTRERLRTKAYAGMDAPTVCLLPTYIAQSPRMEWLRRLINSIRLFSAPRWQGNPFSDDSTIGQTVDALRRFVKATLQIIRQGIDRYDPLWKVGVLIQSMEHDPIVGKDFMPARLLACYIDPQGRLDYELATLGNVKALLLDDASYIVSAEELLTGHTAPYRLLDHRILPSS